MQEILDAPVDLGYCGGEACDAVHLLDGLRCSDKLRWSGDVSRVFTGLVREAERLTPKNTILALAYIPQLRSSIFKWVY